MGAASDGRPNPGRLVELRIADEPASWAAAGFTVDEDIVRIGGVAIRLTGGLGAERGITGWTLAGLAGPEGPIDGLATARSRAIDLADPAGPATDGPSHPNGVIDLDHVVVATPDLERTIAAFEAEGLELRRIREATSFGSPMRQAFFKLGPVVLEVVSGDTGDGSPPSDTPAQFWGLAVDVADLDDTAAHLGEGLGRIKGAVQRGRRIATIRHRDLGLSVPIAAMDHHADRTASELDR